MGKKGFTLIELILVIAILGILAVSALPKFLNLTDQAKAAARDGVVGAVRAGIALDRAQHIADGTDTGFVSVLGGTATLDCLAASPCFANVLANSVVDGKWSVGATTDKYVYDAGGLASAYTYTAADGTFTCTANCE